jgi:hypothetical protein
MTLGLFDLGFLGGLTPPATFLLDAYPNAAAAYSLRQLRTGVTNVVRVRRSSDNTEADFTAAQVSDGSLVAWVGAGNNGFVRTWYDQSGNNRHGQQSTSGSQPAIVTSGSLLTTSGKPKITFTSQFLPLGTGTVINNQSSIHFVLQSSATGTPGVGLLNYNSSPNDDPEIRYGVGNIIASYFNSGFTYDYDASLATQRRLVSQVQSSGVSDTLFVNGSQAASATRAGALSAACSEFTLGRYVRANANRNGEIQELIVYTTGSGASRVAIEADINAHYAIY